MGDAENALPPSKKRAAGRELSRDNPGLDDEEDAPEQETGTFKRASEEVLATRRIVKVRRPQSTSGPSSNPFAGIRLVPPTEASAIPAAPTADAQPANEIRVSDEDNKQSESKIDQAGAESVADKVNDEVSSEANKAGGVHEPAVGEDKIENEGQTENQEKTENEGQTENQGKIENEPTVGEDKTQNEGETKNEEKTENEDEKDNKIENVEPNTEGTPLSSFQQLSSSQNAFTNLSGTGFSSSTFSFGLMSKDGSSLGTGSGSLFASKSDQPSGLGLSINGHSSLFGTSGASIVPKSEGSGFPSMQEVSVETGEENEKAVFTADAALFEFIDGGWKERGKGDLKVNVSESGTERARLVMRLKGIRKLILNASLYPDMKLTNMEKKGVTFACMNSIDEKKDGLSTFALKFKDGSIVEEFRTAVTAHKGKTPAAMKTPENSPKASDD